MKKLRFKAVIKIRDGNPYVGVTAKQAEQLQAGWRKPMPVIIQVNSQPDEPWHINMMPVGDGDYYLYLHGDVRKASNTKVGDKVEVAVWFDQAYHNGPMHPMPDWFQEALNNNSAAQTNWDRLIPSRQKEILRYFSWLKSEEAKQGNLEKAMDMLSGKTGRFMARTWKDGK